MTRNLFIKNIFLYFYKIGMIVPIFYWYYTFGYYQNTINVLSVDSGFIWFFMKKFL